MTRAELKEQKLKKEAEFIESIKGKSISGKEKDKFRTTTVWKEFRNKFKNKVDPITLKKLPKRFSLHHKNLDPTKYTDLKINLFSPHNSKCHSIIHYLYGYYRHDKNILKRIKKELDEMVELNDGKDIQDFKKKQ